MGEWEREAIQAVSTSVFPFCQVRAAATATATADGGGGWDKIRARVSSFLHFLFSFITGELAVEVSQQGSFYAGLSCLSLLHQTAQTNIKALRWDPIAIVCMNTGLRLPLCEDQIDSVADLLRDSSFRMRRPQITQYTRSKTLFL